MSNYNAARSRYEDFDDYENEGFETPTAVRRPTGGLPAYRVAGQNGQITRPQQPPLPQPLPPATPSARRPNVPPMRTPDYADEYPTRRMPAVQPNRRALAQRQPANNMLAKVNLPIAAGSNTRMLVLGGLAIGVLVISYLIVSFAVNTWQTWQDDMTYGRPRITRMEAAVGHNEATGNKTIFVAQNIRGQISITEFPGGDPAKTRVIIGPTLFGKDKDLIPVKLQVKDVNADGQADLIAIADEQQLIYINENGNFRPINEAERNKLRNLGKEDK